MTNPFEKFTKEKLNDTEIAEIQNRLLKLRKGDRVLSITKEEKSETIVRDLHPEEKKEDIDSEIPEVA